MKLLKISLIALFIVSSFAACKKDKQNVVPIEGKWTGKGGLGATADKDFTFIIKPNEMLEVTLANGQVFTGKWKLDGNNFTANYPGGFNITYYYKATFNSTTGELRAGTWGVDPATTNMGTWYMDKAK